MLFPQIGHVEPDASASIRNQLQNSQEKKTARPRDFTVRDRGRHTIANESASLRRTSGKSATSSFRPTASKTASTPSRESSRTRLRKILSAVIDRECRRPRDDCILLGFRRGAIHGEAMQAPSCSRAVPDSSSRAVDQDASGRLLCSRCDEASDRQSRNSKSDKPLPQVRELRALAPGILRARMQTGCRRRVWSGLRRAVPPQIALRPCPSSSISPTRSYPGVNGRGGVPG